MTRPLAAAAAFLAYAILAILIVAGGAAYPGYSHVTQYISELGAIGAPHGGLVSWVGFAPIGALLMAFSALAALQAPRSALRVLGFAGLFLFAAGYLAAAYFRCDFECRTVAPSPSQQFHALFGLLGYIGGPLGLLTLAIDARRWPHGRWLSPLALVCGLVAGAAFLGLEGPARGLAQRVLEAAVGAWILAYAVTLRRA